MKAQLQLYDSRGIFETDFEIMAVGPNSKIPDKGDHIKFRGVRYFVYEAEWNLDIKTIFVKAKRVS